MKRFFGAKFTTTLSISLVLFVLGLMVMGGLVSARLAQNLRERFTVSIVVSDIAPADYGKKLVSKLQKTDYAASALYISKDSALQVLAETLGEDPTRDVLDSNPLYPSVELQLKADYAVTDSIEKIVAGLERTEKRNIAKIEYNNQLLDVVNSNLQRFAIALAILAIILLLICVSLIGNTVRLTLHADRFLINTMRLVGATKWFVRRPFIMTHVCCGLVASAIALLLLALLVYGGVSQGFAKDVANMLVQPMSLIALVGSVTALGVTIPALAAWFAADKYMGRTVDELYLM